MKIYYWCPFLTNIATINSVIRSAKSLAKLSKSKKSNKVSILNSCGEWDFHKKNINNIDIKKLHPFSFYKFLPKEGLIQSRFSFLIIFIVNLFPLIFRIKKDKPKFLIVHLLTILPIILSPLLSKNTKIILRISGLPKLTFIRKTIWKIFSRYIYKITAPTKTTYELLKSSKIFKNKKISLLRDPAIDYEEILKNKNLQISNKFQKKSYALSIGRLTKQKNFSFLVKMFSKYKKDINVDCLLIIGEGEEKIKLQKIIKKYRSENSIHLLGFKKNVYNYINKCKYLISTAEYEDPGFALLEAAFLKKKIITSLVENGPLEMKKNGNFCYFFNFNNEKSFVNAIKNSKVKNIKKIKDAHEYSKQFLITLHCKKLKKILN